ncbi:Uncharacterised protein [Mycobacteroides abscessus subsp. bolletii]|uniref:WXG100 family type VII secretion target n=1 Tax=Mycobacteroides abscessus TaxID=36809 RepID=UPI0009A736C5|nr:WXG100 family type VII secretion target [Mycobacteroides abscessus]SKS74225.1 Uncharacterised protein [Mycobacteroides abscessus subsp. bolletii]SKS82515.1 Uncharacterised protein [Mycobacteroides abscessus subsp. bolletii]
MTEAMRYDAPMMNDHVASQNQLVAGLQDNRRQAHSLIESIRPEWTGMGFTGLDDLHRQIDSAFDAVFQTIQRHAGAIGHAANNATSADSGVNAGFASI